LLYFHKFQILFVTHHESQQVNQQGIVGFV
jgi:hypothetical protein